MNNYISNPRQAELLTTAPEMPIDTVKVMFHVDPTSRFFEKWLQKPVVKENVVLWDEYFVNYYSDNETRIAVKYCPFDRYGNGSDLLFLEFSIPKILYGCNHRMIGDWETALAKLQIEIDNIPGLPHLDIQTGVLYRLDICVNIQTGENVKDYIQALFNAHFRRRETMPYPKEGVMFKTEKSGIALIFYVKFSECHHKDAKGILRVELSLRKKARIKDKLGKKSMTLNDIDRDDLYSAIYSEMRTLGLDKAIVCDRFDAENRLSEIYSQRQVRSLLGYLVELQTKTYAQIREGGTCRETICRYNKLLGGAGISNVSFDGKKSLPPLI
jgi:hypothetical protein